MLYSTVKSPNPLLTLGTVYSYTSEHVFKLVVAYVLQTSTVANCN